MTNIAKKLKDWVNSIRIPKLVDFIFKPFDEALTGAPKENWDRLGLGKLSNIGLPVWSLFAILALVIAVYIFKGFLITIINVVVFGVSLAFLLFLFYAIIKSFR